MPPLSAFPLSPLHIHTTDVRHSSVYVTWSWSDGDGSLDGPPIVSDITVELEPMDRSVGINAAYYAGCGDAPEAVIEAAEEAALDAAMDEHDCAGPEYSRDDEDDRRAAWGAL